MMPPLMINWGWTLRGDRSESGTLTLGSEALGLTDLIPGAGLLPGPVSFLISITGQGMGPQEGCITGPLTWAPACPLSPLLVEEPNKKNRP